MIDSIKLLHVDEEETTNLLAQMLEGEDDRISTRSATTTEAGLEILDNGKIDCIVSDYDLPNQTGIEFLNTVREEHPNLPFILYTGSGSEAVASDAISAGVTDYFQKATGSEQYALMANRIVNAVRAYRSQQQLGEQNRELRQLPRCAVN